MQAIKGNNEIKVQAVLRHVFASHIPSKMLLLQVSIGVKSFLHHYTNILSI